MVRTKNELDIVYIENTQLLFGMVLFSDIFDYGSVYQDMNDIHLLHKMFFMSRKCSVYLYLLSEYVLEIKLKSLLSPFRRFTKCSCPFLTSSFFVAFVNIPCVTLTHSEKKIMIKGSHQK